MADETRAELPSTIWAEVLRFLARVGDGENRHSAAATALYGHLREALAARATPPETAALLGELREEVARLTIRSYAANRRLDALEGLPDDPRTPLCPICGRIEPGTY